MTIHEDLEKLTTTLKQQRDEINLQLHLASMEVKDEWEYAEKDWEEFMEKITDITDEAKETGEEFLDATRAIAEELTLAYDRIKERLKD